MKIHNEQMRALQEVEAHRTKSGKASQEFGVLLNRQLDAGPSTVAPENTAALAPGFLSMPLAGILEDSALPGAQQAKDPSSRMENIFAVAERYADQLALNDKTNLREAYSLLESMSSQIAEFKSRFPNMREEQPALAAMLNEVDVLAVTETFKFNRGDYS